MLTLTIKTASKPLAAQIENYVMSHPQWRPRVIGFARSLHKWDVRITRGSEGKSGNVFVGELAEDKAVQLASKVVSEGTVYSIAVVLLLLETDRRYKEDALKKAKEATVKAETQALHQQHLRAEVDLRRQQAELQEILHRMEERLGSLEHSITSLATQSSSPSE